MMGSPWDPDHLDSFDRVFWVIVLAVAAILALTWALGPDVLVAMLTGPG
jgi:hypothetical protein